MLKTIMALCFLASPVLGDLLQSTSCIVGAQSYSGSLDCSFSAPVPPQNTEYAVASASTTAGYLSATADAHAFTPTVFPCNCPTIVGAQATALVLETYYITVAGQGPGFVEVTPDVEATGQLFEYYGYAAAFIDTPWFDLGSSNEEYTGGFSYTFPATLGGYNTMLFMGATVSAPTDQFSDATAILGNIQFFAADGVTPVAFTVSDTPIPTPEPTTLALLFLGVSSMVIRLSRPHPRLMKVDRRHLPHWNTSTSP